MAVKQKLIDYIRERFDFVEKNKEDKLIFEGEIEDKEILLATLDEKDLIADFEIGSKNYNNDYYVGYAVQDSNIVKNDTKLFTINHNSDKEIDFEKINERISVSIEKGASIDMLIYSNKAILFNVTTGILNRIKKVNKLIFNTSENRLKLGQFENSSELNYIGYMELNDKSNPNLLRSMFYGCSHLKEVDSIKVNVNNINTAESMFYGCRELISINHLDISNVTSMSNMFTNCNALTYIKLITTQTTIDKLQSVINELPSHDDTDVERIIDLSEITTITDLSGVTAPSGWTIKLPGGEA